MINLDIHACHKIVKAVIFFHENVPKLLVILVRWRVSEIRHPPMYTQTTAKTKPYECVVDHFIAG